MRVEPSGRSDAGSLATALVEMSLTPALVVTCAEPDRILHANAVLQTLLGRPVATGSPVRDVLAGVRLPGIALGPGWRDLVAGQLVGKDGVRSAVPVQVDTVADGNGRLLAILQIDVSEAGLHAACALWESEQRLQVITDAVDALIYMKRADGRYLLINSFFERETGVHREEVVGMTDPDIFGEELGTIYPRNDRQVLEAGQSMEFEEHVPSGKLYLSTKFPLFDGAGVAYAIGGIATGITVRSQAERSARAAGDQAERASAAKTEFLSRMSHELRTPLNSVLGFGELLALDLTGEQAAMAGRILRAGRHLLDLINEVLDITRVEHVGPDVSVVPVLAAQALDEALIEHGVALDFQCPVLALRRRFHRVGGRQCAARH